MSDSVADYAATTQPSDVPQALLHPRNIAIVGASDNPSKLIAARPVQYLQRYGFAGGIYPINPRYEWVQGLASHPTIADVPDTVDLALIALPREQVLAALQACADAGVLATIVFSSGFAEVEDGHGNELQEQISDLATRTGMAVVGPNSQGLANVAAGFFPCFSTAFADGDPQVDRVAVVSQSGAVAAMTYNLLVAGGSGTKYWVSTGNEASVSVAQVVRAVVEDADVDTICVYLESVRDHDVLTAAANRAAELGKTIIVTRSATTAPGWHAATRHTGAGARDPFGARARLPRSPALLCADSLEQMAALATLSRAGKTVGDGHAAIISNSGGLGVMAADAIESSGLQLSHLGESTHEHLREFLPAFAATNNPIDVTAQLLNDKSLLSRTLPALRDDGEVDIVVIALGAVGDGYDVDQIIHDLTEANRSTNQLYVVIWVGSRVDIRDRLRHSGIPVFTEFRTATSALASWTLHHRTTEPSMPTLVEPYLDDLRPGQVYSSSATPVSPDDLDLYAHLVGQADEADNIHVDAHAARRTGFRDRVSAGLHILSYLTTLGKNTSLWAHATMLRSLTDVRFLSPVLAGDHVRLDLRVDRISPSLTNPTRGTARFAFTIFGAEEDGNERDCVTGHVEYLFHRRTEESS